LRRKGVIAEAGLLHLCLVDLGVNKGGTDSMDCSQHLLG